MKVHELIQRLQLKNQDSQVVIGNETYVMDISGVEILGNGTVVIWGK